MYKILLASAAAVLMTGSLANAQFLLGQDDSGHKQVRNMWAERSVADERHPPRRSATRIPGPHVVTGKTINGRRISPGFLLGETANGPKRVINQYSGYAWPR